MNPEFVRSADGTEIAFERTGSGPPLILVGGALSDRGAAGPLAALLAERLTAIAFDRRGRGDSGDTAPYAVEREIEDLAALIEAAGGRASVLGHSSGGALAIHTVRAGLPIDRLAVYEPPFIVDDARPPIPDDYVVRLEDLVEEGRPGDAVAYFMTVGVGLPPTMVDQMRAAPMWPALEAVAHTLAYDGRVVGAQMAGEPLPASWRDEVTIPTLVMDGGASPDWVHHTVDALEALLPDVRRVTLEGQDHGPAPELLAPALLDFFAA